MRLRRIAAPIGFAAALLALVSSAAHAEKVLRASLNTELTVLDPIATTINATRVFAYLVWDKLVGMDNEGRYHPQMLEGWQIGDDRLTYTFKLRDGLKWSDGTPVTAEDCVASIKRWAKREPLGKRMMEAARGTQAGRREDLRPAARQAVRVCHRGARQTGQHDPGHDAGADREQRTRQGYHRNRRLRPVHLPAQRGMATGRPRRYSTATRTTGRAPNRRTGSPAASSSRWTGWNWSACRTSRCASRRCRPAK